MTAGGTYHWCNVSTVFWLNCRPSAVVIHWWCYYWLARLHQQMWQLDLWGNGFCFWLVMSEFQLIFGLSYQSFSLKNILQVLLIKNQVKKILSERNTLRFLIFCQLQLGARSGWEKRKSFEALPETLRQQIKSFVSKNSRLFLAGNHWFTSRSFSLRHRSRMWREGKNLLASCSPEKTRSLARMMLLLRRTFTHRWIIRNMVMFITTLWMRSGSS